MFQKKMTGPVKRILIVSFDAVGTEDLALLKTLPNFKRFFRHAALAERVESVYPSITYPAHTTIVTGLTPAHHGVVNNYQMQPERFDSPDWMWQRSFVKGPTLYDAAAEQLGFKVASILWPVTAGAKIKYNAPEILANRPWQSQAVECLKAGSPLFEAALIKRFPHVMDGVNQPNLDNFAMLSALDTQLRFRPDMMLLHLTDVDTLRHKHGVHSKEATEALKRHDKRLGELLAVLSHIENAGSYEDGFPKFKETAIVLLGDHYQKDIHTMSYPNYYLWKKGYIKVRRDKIIDYTAYAQTADGACYIYVNRKKGLSAAFMKKLEADIHKMAAHEGFGIQKVFDSGKAAELGADPGCAFMLEGKDGYAFGSDYLVPYLPVSQVDSHKKVASHGYLPKDDSYTTFFGMVGAGVREGTKLPRMQLIDEGPTIAALLGIDIGMVDGRVIREALN